MINQNYLFHFFVTRKTASNNKNNSKFEKVSFTKLKKRLMITEITNKVITNLK